MYGEFLYLLSVVFCLELKVNNFKLPMLFGPGKSFCCMLWLLMYVVLQTLGCMIVGIGHLAYSSS